jgi:hypothetical protein
LSTNPKGSPPPPQPDSSAVSANAALIKAKRTNGLTFITNPMPTFAGSRRAGQTAIAVCGETRAILETFG